MNYWSNLDPGHDAFARGALGKNGWLALSLLPPEGLTVEALMKRCGYTARTVEKTLRAMQTLGAVECDENGLWHPNPVLDLGEVARLAGTAGRRESQRARFKAEQEANAAFLDAA